MRIGYGCVHLQCRKTCSGESRSLPIPSCRSIVAVVRDILKSTAREGAACVLPFCMRMALAQLNQRLGDLAGNAGTLLAAIDAGRRAGASLVVTPELSLSGYPPEDLLLRPAFLDACASELAALAAEVHGVITIVGFPERHDGARHNALAVLRDGRVAGIYRKRRLPNYTVFDEE